MFAYCNNNPVSKCDPTGNWSELSTFFLSVAAAAVVVAAVAATVATCGAALPALAAVSGTVFTGISVGTATSVATGAMVVAGVSTVAAATTEAVEKTKKRSNSVYVLKDDTGTVQYVGRTNNVSKRKAAHHSNPYRAGLEMEVVASGLTLAEAKVLEQAGMAYHHTINTANKMNNQINGIAPKYWGAGKELALGVLNYGWNQMTNEILYWVGS